MDQDTLPEKEQGAHDKLDGGLRPDETAKLDQMEAGLRNSSPSGGTGSRLQSAGKFIAQNKKPIIGGGVGVGVISGVIALTPLFGAFELLHIFNNIFAHVRKEITMELDKELNKEIDKVIQKQADKALGKYANESSTGPLEDEAAKVNLESLEPDLEANGLKGTFQNGELVGLSDSNAGENYDENALSQGDPNTSDNGVLTGNESVGADMATATQALDMGDRRLYLPLEAAQYGTEFSLPTQDDGKNDTGEEQMDADMEKATLDGASSSEIADIAGTEAAGTGGPTDSSQNAPAPNQQTKPGEPTTDPTSETTRSNIGGDLGSAADQASKEFLAGTPSDIAAEDAAQSFLLHTEESGQELDPVAPAMMVCSFKSAIQKADNVRVFHLITLLIRHGNLLATAVSQLKDGKMTGKSMGGLLSLLNGNPNAPTIKTPKQDTGKQGESALPFSSSAEWQRTTGGTVTDKTPDLDPMANPSVPPKDVYSQITTGLGKIPGANFSCSVLNSPFSFIVGAGASLIQIVGNIADFGAEEVADIAANQAFFVAFAEEVVKPAVKYVANLTVTGAEDAVGWTNITSSGLDLATGTFAKAMGAVPTDNATTAALTLQADQYQSQLEARKPLLAQLFDTNDENSVVSRLVVKMPLEPVQSATRNIASLMTNPLSAIKSFGALIPSVRADQTSDINPHGFVPYTFKGQNNYDPFANEQYLRTSTVVLTYTDSSGNVHHDTMPMLASLGDPSTYQPGATDSDNNDLMHCFVNNTSTPSYLNVTSDSVNYNGGVCGSVGQVVQSSAGTNPDGSPKYSDTYSPPQWAQIYCAHDSGCGDSPSVNVPGDLQARYSQYVVDLSLMQNLVDRTAGVTP